MKYKEYRAKIEYDSDDNIFVGEVLGLNDVLSFHANNTADLEKHFHDCIDEYLNMCKKYGKVPEKEYTGSFSVRVEPEDQRNAVVCAAALNISLNQYFGRALAAFNSINLPLI